MGEAKGNVYDKEDFEGIFSGYDQDEGPNISNNAMHQFTCDDSAGLKGFHTIFQPLVYSVVLLLGVTGNSLMMTVLLRSRGHLRITEIYLLHLALADLLLLATFPFALVQVFMRVVFGDVLCKLLGMLNRLNFLSSSLLLACISFDRYLAIVHAVPSLQSRRPRNVHLTCLTLWLLCLALSIPNMVFLSVGKNQTDPSQTLCSFYSHGIHANNWRLTDRVMTHVLCFFLPLGVMTYCYTAVGLSLYRSPARQRSQEKKGAIRLAFLVTAVFCLCWLPYNITVLMKTMIDLRLVHGLDCQALTRMKISLVVAESLGYSHCCLNPLLYAFAGQRFRQDLLRLLVRWGCGRVCGRVVIQTSSSRASASFSEGLPTATTNIL